MSDDRLRCGGWYETTSASVANFFVIHSPLCRSDRPNGPIPEELLANNRMNSPIAIHYLCNAKIDRDRHQRNSFVFRQAPCSHQKSTHFSESILDGEIKRGSVVDVALSLLSQLRQVIWMAKAQQNPLVFCFDQRIGQIRERLSRKIGPLVQYDLEDTGQGAFNGRATNFRIALRCVRISY